MSSEGTDVSTLGVGEGDAALEVGTDNVGIALDGPEGGGVDFADIDGADALG